MEGSKIKKYTNKKCKLMNLHFLFAILGTYALIFFYRQYIIIKLKYKKGGENMQVKKEEILHIAKLACLNLKEDEVEEYRKNLQDILNFANVVNSVNTDNVSETIGTTNNENIFREDEIKQFTNIAGLLQNAPEQENNMFRIPKVI